MGLFQSLSVCFSSISKSFSISMEANAESSVCPVMFLAQVLIRFNANNVSLTEAVGTGISAIKSTQPTWVKNIQQQPLGAVGSLG